MKSVLRLILKSIFNPITLTNIFAPILILKVNFLKLRDMLSNPSYLHYSELKSVINNSWVDALTDLNIQYIVFIVAFIFTFFQAISGIIAVTINSKIGNIVENWSNDTRTLIYLTITGILLLVGIIVIFTGGLISPEQIVIFKENSQDPTLQFGGMHTPPFNANIFIARFILVIYGIYLTYFLKNILPKITNTYERNE